MPKHLTNFKSHLNMENMEKEIVVGPKYYSYSYYYL